MTNTRWKTGVYRIRNLVNGKVYIGGAYVSLCYRWYLHQRDLNNGRHGNEHLLSSWRKYGSENFKFEVIERCSPESCKEREQYWIDFYRPFDRTKGYNKSPTAGSALGVKHSAKTRKKYSAAMRRRMEDPAEREKVGRGMRGKKMSKESKRLISEAAKKMWQDKGIRERIISANKRAVRTEEFKLSQSILKTGKKQTEETKKKISAALLGKRPSEETKMKMSASQTRAWKERKR